MIRKSAKKNRTRLTTINNHNNNNETILFKCYFLSFAKYIQRAKDKCVVALGGCRNGSFL